MPIKNDFYTKEQVMEKLEVAASTVYHLAKTQRIETEVLPEGVSRTKRYSKSSVDDYYSTKNNVPKGLSINDFAKLHKVTNQRLYQLINKLNLSIEKVVVNNRKRLILSADQQAILRNELQQKTHKGTKSDFYSSSKDIALFQLFFDRDKVPYRITRNERNEWGVLVAPTNHFLCFEAAVKDYQLIPAYTLHQPSIPSTAYAKFSLKVSNKMTYDFLDLCYTYLGIENIHVLQKDTTLEVSLKSTKLPVINSGALLDYLNECSLNVEVEEIEGQYAFHIKDRAVTITLDGDVYTALKIASNAQRISLSDYIKNVLEQHFINK